MQVCWHLCNTPENVICLSCATCRIALVCVLDGHAGSRVAALVGRNLNAEVLQAGLLSAEQVSDKAEAILCRRLDVLAFCKQKVWHG